MPQDNAPLAPSTATDNPLKSAGHDFLVGGITMASILLLVGTGTDWVRTLFGLTDRIRDSDGAITATLLLNIALILFGWRRYRELRAEVERRIDAEQEALHLASCDALTGLRNRRALTDEGEVLLSQWRAKGLRPAALAIDIDAFKSINDLLGHAVGDSVISSVADTMRELAPEDALMARTGGDEFVVLLPVGRQDDEALNRLGRDLISALAIAVPVEGIAASTSSSVGGAVAINDETTLDTLLRHADTAMYRAKAMGRSRYCRFDLSMEAMLARRDEVEQALRFALENGELFPVYEPLVDLASNEPIGYEMLARWTSQSLGDVTPAEFISVAEEKGLIAAVSESLFRAAFNNATHWPDYLSLSVNVSRFQLRDPWFAQKLLRLLEETGFPATRLIIEMTEGAIADNLQVVQTTFDALRQRGVRMALDDFGTGHASLASLRSLEFDSIKIDREFITRMAESEAADTIAAAIIQLGQSLGLPIIAEGIENRATVDRLVRLCCPVGQGHFFGGSQLHDEILARYSAVDRRRA